MWTLLLGACALTHIFVYKRKTALIMLKVLSATIQNFSPSGKSTPVISFPQFCLCIFTRSTKYSLIAEYVKPRYLYSSDTKYICSSLGVGIYFNGPE